MAVEVPPPLPHQGQGDGSRGRRCVSSIPGAAAVPGEPSAVRPSGVPSWETRQCAWQGAGDCAVQGVATAEGVGSRVANDAGSSLRVTLPGTCSVKLGNSTFVPGAKGRRQLGAHLVSRVWVEITLTVAAWRASGKETLGDECGRLARRAGR